MRGVVGVVRTRREALARSVLRRGGAELVEASGRTRTDVASHDTARLYSCARCRSLTTICSRCDRGNLCCSDCAPLARQEARQRAAKRYQQSPEGRRRHAARQRQYRERKRDEAEKVTHRGIVATRCVVATAEELEPTKTSRRAPCSRTFEVIACGFCSGVCSDFLRCGYRPRNERRPPSRDRRHRESIYA